MKKLGPKYERAVKEDLLSNLGFNIHLHRHLRDVLSMKQVRTMTPEKIVEALDKMYQKSLDDVIDSIMDCLEMRLEKNVLNGLRESQLIKRGFRELKDARAPRS